MKKLLFILYFIAPALCLAQPFKIRVGSSPNNEDGSTPKDAYTMLNSNLDFFKVGIGVDVKSFGATGDGVTDDTTAVQNWANFICSTNVVGIVSPAKGAGYLISQPITFTNTANIQGRGGVVYGPSDFPLTRCQFIQVTPNTNGLQFLSYADTIRIDGIQVTASSPNNFTNPCAGFFFDGAIGSHMGRIVQCGAKNFGWGAYSGDLAAVTFASCGFNQNATGIQLSNHINGNYPLEIDGCVITHNWSNQVVCLSTITPLLIENSIITPLDLNAHGITSFSPSTTIINCRIQPGTSNNLIALNGGQANIIGLTIQSSGAQPRYDISATNCLVNLQSQILESNSLDGSAVFLYGGSTIQAWPSIQFTKNDGAGNLSTNVTVMQSANAPIPSVPATAFVPPSGNAVTIWNSNKVTFWVSATKTNLANDAR